MSHNNTNRSPTQPHLSIHTASGGLHSWWGDENDGTVSPKGTVWSNFEDGWMDGMKSVFSGPGMMHDEGPEGSLSERPNRKSWASFKGPSMTDAGVPGYPERHFSDEQLHYYFLLFKWKSNEGNWTGFKRNGWRLVKGLCDKAEQRARDEGKGIEMYAKAARALEEIRLLREYAKWK